jgi:general stress protein 26
MIETSSEMESYRNSMNERRIMSQIELSYEDLKQEVISEIQKHERMVLATSEGEFVTARTMRCVPNGLNIYNLTNRNSRKYEQITANPKVALAYGNLQIEGVASLKGHPVDKENVRFIETFQEKQPDAYERWSQRGHFQNPDVMLIEVAPRRIALYKEGALPSESCIDVLDISNKKAYKLTRKGDRPTF